MCLYSSKKRGSWQGNISPQIDKIWYTKKTMFIDHTSSLQSQSSDQPTSVPEKKPNKKWLIIFAGILVLLVAGGVWYLYGRENKEMTLPIIDEEEEPNLPGNPTLSEPGSEDPNSSDFKAENLAFGTFYKSFYEPFQPNIKAVSLPLNVKSDVSNYYDVSRKINLDAAVTNLNRNGFAIIPSPFTKNSSNFFSLYGELEAQEVPLLLTSDFVIYYYENSLKRIYQSIESSYFYDNLWKINKELFEVANGRYLERQRKLGSATDSLLEAQRLEVGYFATALALLTPESSQVMTDKDSATGAKFSQLEANKYQFSVPDYLTNDVTKELALIKEAEKQEKSPLLLYSRDYKEFAVPTTHTSTAKLRNVYLAEKWQTTVFPLYYQEQSCENCILDQDDWTINQIAAYLISEHISANQSLKNEWAKVYKVISYFSGLRSGLTYLHYQAARQTLFENKTAEEIFTGDVRGNLEKLRTEVAKVSFKAQEGGYNASNSQERPLIGMRLLQPLFWPDHYIYNRLTLHASGNHNQLSNAQGLFTGCQDQAKNVYRCRGFGFDVVGTITNNTPETAFYQNNINYENYRSERQNLQAEFEGFTKGEWYVNQFWTMLSIVKAFINDRIGHLPYMQSVAWKERQARLATASLASLRLTPDEWQVQRAVGDSSLETGSGADKFHYVEVSSNLQDELVANASMLSGALSSLKVLSDNDVQFRELIDRLKTIRDITRQELRGEALSSTQQQFISDAIRQYRVNREGERSTTVTFYDSVMNRTRTVKQSFGQLQLLVLVYEQNGKKFLAVGPVFNYSEQ